MMTCGEALMAAMLPHVRATTPAELSPKIAEFGAKLADGQAAVFVPVQVEAGAKYGECLPNVQAVVEAKGGVVRTGWCIWEVPTILLQAERHAVWEVDGELIDVTPKPGKEERICFLPDTSAWDGNRVANTIFPIRNHRMVFEYCDVLQQLAIAQVNGKHDPDAAMASTHLAFQLNAMVEREKSPAITADQRRVDRKRRQRELEKWKRRR